MNKRKNYIEIINEESQPKQPIYPAQKLNPQTESQRLETFQKLKAKYGIPIEKGNSSRALD